MKDDLSAARGIVHGIWISAVIWLVILWIVFNW